MKIDNNISARNARPIIVNNSNKLGWIVGTFSFSSADDIINSYAKRLT